MAEIIDRYNSSLSGAEVDIALQDMANHTSERFAKGTAGGEPVPSGQVGYQDNAKYYALQAKTDADRAESAVPIGTESAVLWTMAQNLTDSAKGTARANIGAGTFSKNIVENGDFLINQRGIYGSMNGYGFDRWYGTYHINANTPNLLGLEPNQFAIQPFSDEQKNSMLGKTCTLSIKFRDGAIYTGTFVYNITSQGVTIPLLPREDRVICSIRTVSEQFAGGLNIVGVGTVNLDRVWIEIGSNSTLANAPIPSKQEELAICQYYLEPISAVDANNSIAFGNGASNQIYIPIKLKPKRITPSILNNTWQNLRYGLSSLGSQPTAVSILSRDNNSGSYTLVMAGTFTADTTYRVGIVVNQYVLFSAEFL